MYNQNSDLMKQEKFMLPTMIESDFSAEELAEDADGLQMSFPRVKILPVSGPAPEPLYRQPGIRQGLVVSEF